MCDNWPTKGEKIDLESDKIYPLRWGLVYRVVCAPKAMTNDQINDIVSRNDPPGTSLNRWEVADDDTAKEHPNWKERSGSETARAECPDCAERHHVLMHC